MYSTYLGGTGADSAFGIDIDSTKNVYVVGSTNSQEFSSIQNTNVFVTKFDSSGAERSYSAVLGGDGDDTGFGMHWIIPTMHILRG